MSFLYLCDMRKVNIENGSKSCSHCKLIKKVFDFYRSKTSCGYHSWCKECVISYKLAKNKTKDYSDKFWEKVKADPELRKSIRDKARERQRKDRVGRLFRSCKQRAKEENISFDIELKDIIIPDTCPILQIPLNNDMCNGNLNLPSVDRIIPERGYTKDNIIVVSRKANMMKSNASIEELLRFSNYFIKNYGE